MKRKSQLLVSTRGEYSQMFDSPVTNGFYPHVILQHHLQDRRIRSVMHSETLTERENVKIKADFISSHENVHHSAPRESISLISSSHVVVKLNQEKASGSKAERRKHSDGGKQRAAR